MKIDYHTVYLKKRFPLRISRGEIAGSDNLFVSLTEDGVTGWGEMAPGDTEGAGTAAQGQAMLEDFCADGLAPSIHDTWQNASDAGVAPCALAALAGC